PYVRGQSRSLETDRIIHEVNTLVNAGYREVVISGINLGRWGKDLGLVSGGGFGKGTASAVPSEVALEAALAAGGAGLTRNIFRKPRAESRKALLADLIRSILAETSLEKLRISSVEPMDWSDDLISLMASSPRIAKHAHVPMQSGSDAVLRRMHRKYRP